MVDIVSHMSPSGTNLQSRYLFSWGHLAITAVFYLSNNSHPQKLFDGILHLSTIDTRIIKWFSGELILNNIIWKRIFGFFFQNISHVYWMAVDLRGSLNKFPDFFVWALLLIVHTWNSSSLRNNLLRLQCTCCTVQTTGRPHGGPLVWVFQWPSSQPLSSPQLSHNDDSMWA